MACWGCTPLITKFYETRLRPNRAMMFLLPKREQEVMGVGCSRLHSQVRKGGLAKRESGCQKCDTPGEPRDGWDGCSVCFPPNRNSGAESRYSRISLTAAGTLGTSLAPEREQSTAPTLCPQGAHYLLGSKGKQMDDDNDLSGWSMHPEPPNLISEDTGQPSTET